MVLGIEVGETSKGGFSNFSKDIHSYRPKLSRDLIERTEKSVSKQTCLGKRILPYVHILHAHDHIIVVAHEGTVEVHDELSVTIKHDLQLSHNPATHFRLCFDMDDLVSGHSQLLQELYGGHI